MISDALASAMKPNPKRRRATTGRARRAARVKAFPRDQQERLALTGRQLSHRCRQTSAHFSRRLPTHSRAPGKTLQPGGQRASATVGAVLVCQHATSDPEQPRQRIIPDRIRPAPRDQERLRHDILNRRGRRPANHIATHRPVVRREQPLEHRRRILMTTHPTPYCPADPTSLHRRHRTARRVRRAFCKRLRREGVTSVLRAVPAQLSDRPTDGVPRRAQRIPTRTERHGDSLTALAAVSLGIGTRPRGTGVAPEGGTVGAWVRTADVTDEREFGN